MVLFADTYYKEWDKMDQFKSFLDFVQKDVDKLAKEHFTCKCKPEFIVSVLYDFDEDNASHKVILTIKHGVWQLSEVLFPKIEQGRYGYPPLLDSMNYLYNRTM